MSTNDPARPSSRRSFLAGLYAAFTVAPVTMAWASPLHPADRAILTWLGACSAYNREPDDLPDGVTDPLLIALDGTEDAIRNLPPSIMSAAAVLLVEITYETSPTLRDDPARLRIFAALQPHLSGFIGRIVSDLLDNPDRPFRESLVWRLRSGEIQA
ncbi:hypothetical protein [Enterovirga rhinocerotis]|uniref:Uncharacterized protein n=1 Tax=Enterovirga rhinocerotis TaxID=1339210 RepID=A0A4R7BXT6_9HYPH|nr:hypothetical protein [Enterovirga rhinocerotis]TDR89545.1 hypothetical protein EV668_2375 [Enterovirga rhinocerotis]